MTCTVPRKMRAVRTRLDCDLVATGPRSTPAKLGTVRVLIMSPCAALLAPSLDDTTTAERCSEVPVVETTPSSITACPALADSPQFSSGTSVVGLDQELLLNQLMYVLIDTRAVLDSSGKPFVGETSTTTTIGSSSLSLGSLLAEVSPSVLPFEVWSNNRRWLGARVGQVSNVELVLPSGPTGMDPSHTSFFQLQSIGTKMVGPGASEMVLDFTTVDGASVFIFSVIFQEVGVLHLALDTDAFTLSLTSGVALTSPAIFNVAPDSEEPIEDLLFPDVCSTSDVPSDTAFYFTERSMAWTDGSKMIRTTTDGEEDHIPSGKSNRVHGFALGSSVSIDPPTILADGSEVSVVVDEGAFLDMARHSFVPWIASSECVKRDKTRCVWHCNKNRRVCESALQTCKYVSSLRPTRCTTREFERSEVLQGVRGG